jgi:hypothetical protein
MVALAVLKTGDRWPLGLLSFARPGDPGPRLQNRAGVEILFGG